MFGLVMGTVAALADRIGLAGVFALGFAIGLAYEFLNLTLGQVVGVPRRRAGVYAGAGGVRGRRVGCVGRGAGRGGRVERSGMTRGSRAVGTALAVALVLGGCRSRPGLEDRLEQVKKKEAAVVAKIEAIQARQRLYAAKLAAYQKRLEAVRQQRARLEREIRRRTPVLVRPGRE